ncbi:hypothetical protein FHG87_023834, partial [Trinorchestia longiramus]
VYKDKKIFSTNQYKLPLNQANNMNNSSKNSKNNSNKNSKNSSNKNSKNSSNKNSKNSSNKNSKNNRKSKNNDALFKVFSFDMAGWLQKKRWLADQLAVTNRLAVAADAVACWLLTSSVAKCAR